MMEESNNNYIDNDKDYDLYNYDSTLNVTIKKIAALINDRNECYSKKIGSSGKYAWDYFYSLASIMAGKKNKIEFALLSFNTDEFGEVTRSLIASSMDCFPFYNDIECPHYLQSYYLLTKQFK